MQNDQLWKAILEDVFEDFLTFFYPETEQMFDFSRGFKYLDKELQQLFPPEKGSYSTRYIDKLVQVYTKEGNDQWVLIHVEVQGYAQQDFERRMFRYYSRILDKYDRRIAAFAIFTDTNPEFHPLQFTHSFLGTDVLYKFNSYKVLEQDVETLRGNPNPFACVILAVIAAIEGKIHGDATAFKFKKQLFLEFKASNLSEEKKYAILLFLKNYVRFEDNEFDNKFEVEVIQETQSSMGIAEYLIEQEREKVKQERIKRLQEREKAKKALRAKEKLTAKNLKAEGVDIHIISKVTGLSTEEIKKL